MLTVCSKKAFVYSVGSVVLSCLLGWMIYPELSRPDKSVFFLRSIMPADSETTSSAGSVPQISAISEIAVDPDQKLLEELMKDDLRLTYETLEEKAQWQTVRMRVTGYCACRKCCGKFSDGITASNHRIRRGDVFVAADKFYGFGTEMVIPGYNRSKTVTVQDRGRVIKGNRLDLFFDSHRRAQKWGVKYLDVLVKVD
jgi:3D (Asp-Asp-Asp) domain-containing protein